MSLDGRITALHQRIAAEVKTLRGQRAASPAHAGVAGRLLHDYDPLFNAYNARTASLRRSRHALARAVEGSGRFNAVAMGDSLFVGSNGGGGIVERFSVAKQIARCLSEFTGAPMDTGFTCFPQGVGSINDRVSVTGAVTNNAPFVTIPNGGTWTFTTEDAGDEVVIMWTGLSANWAYSIDGKADVAVSTTGGAVYNTTVSSGHGDTTHTVTVKATGGNNVYLCGVWVRKPSGISVHNMSFGGSRSTGGADSANWTTGVTQSALSNVRAGERGALALDPDLVLISIGGNELLDQSAAISLAGLETMLGWYPNADKLLIVSPYFDGTDTTQAALYTAGKYDLADEYNAVVVDWLDMWNSLATAAANGVLGPDNAHPDYGLMREMGRQIAVLVAGGAGPPGIAPPPVVVHAPATTYTLKDSDDGRRIRFSNAAAVAVTIPNTLPAGFECTWEQFGAGVPTFAAGAGASLRSRGSVFKSAGQYAVGGISRIDADEFLLYGDIAA